MWTAKLFHLFHFLLNYCHFICGTPIYFDHKKQSYSCKNSYIRWLICIGNLAALLMVIFIFLERLVWILSKRYDDPMAGVLFMLGIIGYSIPLISFGHNMLNCYEITETNNRYLKYFNTFEG